MSGLESKKPRDNAFQQQRLKAWQPLLTPKWVIATFLSVGCAFIPIGVVCLLMSNSVVEISHRYDQLGSGTHTINTITAPAKMEAPIYFYYKLSEFYQNHRRYVKSRSDKQLRGDSHTSDGSCDPYQMEGDKHLYPCGLVAQSMFNDTFSLSINGGTPLSGNDWTSEGIAWPTDKNDKFKRRTTLNPDETDVGPAGRPVWTAANNEEFIVWMRTSGMPTFKKLHRRVLNQNINKGDQLTFTVNSNYPVASFSGEKHFVLSTVSPLGGKNDFLAMLYIATGTLSLVAGIAFLIKNHVSPRPLGKMEYFKWSDLHLPEFSHNRSEQNQDPKDEKAA